jgi:hypothetical protein
MTYPYVAGYSGHMSGDNGNITRIVIHGTCSATIDGGAMNNAHYFQDPNSGGLAHYVVDPGAVVQCCPENIACWHAPPNHGSIGVELCDPQIGSGARWQSSPDEAMLRRAAKLVVEIAGRTGVPLVQISTADVKAGKHGICGHVNVSEAFGQSSHTDPGPDFPWAHFMALVGAAAQPSKPAYVPPVGDSPSKHPWPLAPTAVIHVGNTHAAVDTVARYLKQPVDPNHVFTKFLATALAHWQDRNGQSTTPAGILNLATWKAMK